MKLFKILFLAAMLLLSLGGRVAAQDNVGRYIIGFLADALPPSFQDILTNLVAGTDMAFDIILEITGVNLTVVLMPINLTRLVADLPFVDFIEEDQMVFLPPNITNKVTSEFPGGDLTPLQSEELLPYGIQLVGALNVSNANIANRKVCIIDTGYDLGHVDLPSDSSVVTGSDDAHAGSWSSDGNAHGTHVAGTIAALGGNNKGVVGVNGNGALNLHIVKFLDADGMSYASTTIDAVQKCADAGANIVSMSLGRTGLPLQSEINAYTSFHENGMLIIAAAGNDGASDYSWPASYDAVVSVAAIDRFKNVASFSQYNDQVELAAPGVDVVSTIPGNLYASFDGTSMATPHVSGVAALVWSNFPDKSAQEIRAALRATAEDLGPAGRDVDYGYGLVRADLADAFLRNGNVAPTEAPTSIPSPTSAPPSTDCVDEPADWVDAGGDGCVWYSSGFWCLAFGSFNADPVYGKTANEVCCTCGGGSASSCLDDPPGWVDSSGDGCDWYGASDSRCASFGNGYENQGKTAIEACCVCHGITPASTTALEKVDSSRTGSTAAPTSDPSGTQGADPTSNSSANWRITLSFCIVAGTLALLTV